MTTVETPRPTEPAPERPGAPVAGRAARREAAHEFRPRRSIAASLVAAVLAAAAALLAIEIIIRLIDESNGLLPVDRLAELGRETSWEDGLTRTIAGLAVLLGLLLLWLALWPGRPRAYGLATSQPAVVMALSRPALRRIASQAAEAVEGVSRARARDRRGAVTVRVDTPLREPGDLADQVRRRVGQRLDEYRLLRQPQVRVDIRRRMD